MDAVEQISKLPRGRPKMHPTRKRSLVVNTRLAGSEYGKLLDIRAKSRLGLSEIIRRGIDLVGLEFGIK
jgi:hypothetical protein